MYMIGVRDTKVGPALYIADATGLPAEHRETMARMMMERFRVPIVIRWEGPCDQAELTRHLQGGGMIVERPEARELYQAVPETGSSS